MTKVMLIVTQVPALTEVERTRNWRRRLSENPEKAAEVIIYHDNDDDRLLTMMMMTMMMMPVSSSGLVSSGLRGFQPWC